MYKGGCAREIYTIICESRNDGDTESNSLNGNISNTSFNSNILSVSTNDMMPNRGSPGSSYDRKDSEVTVPEEQETNNQTNNNHVLYCYPSCDRDRNMIAP